MRLGLTGKVARSGWAALGLLALLTAGGLCGLRSTRARAHEALASAGEALLTYAHASHRDAARTLVVNGLSLRMVSGATPDGVHAVLDALHARCRVASGELERALTPRRARLPFEPVLRADDARSGHVACLDLGAGPVGSEQLLARLRRFIATTDLTELGDLRFFWARREGALTHYIGVAAEGPLPLAKAFPRDGDAPGADVPGVPRPAAARRVLSAFVRDAEPLLTSYETRVSPADALAAFTAQLERAGFEPSPVPAAPGGLHRLHARRDGRSLLALAHATTRGVSVLTLLWLR